MKIFSLIKESKLRAFLLRGLRQYHQINIEHRAIFVLPHPEPKGKSWQAQNNILLFVVRFEIVNGHDIQSEYASDDTETKEDLIKRGPYNKNKYCCVNI